MFDKKNPETTGAMVAFAGAKGMFYGALLFAAQAYFLREYTPYWLAALPVLLVLGAIIGAATEWRRP